MSPEAERGLSNGREVITTLQRGEIGDIFTEKGLEKQQKDRWPLDYLAFRERLLSGELPQPKNAHDTLYAAITALEVAPRRLPSGIIEYPFFSEHPLTPVYGLHGVKADLVNYILAGRDSGGKDTGLLLVSKTGAGKNTFVDGLKTRFEERIKMSDPVYGIANCPIQENPVNMESVNLNLRQKQELRERHGIEVNDLCPDCQQRMSKGELTEKNAKVVPIEFSIGLRRGISKLDPKLTRSKDPQAWENADKLILGANRGMLEIAELFQQDYDYLRTLNDTLRGRTLQAKNGQYTLDMFIIAHTTIDELKRYGDEPDLSAFLERLHKIYLPYNTSSTDETKIYMKGMKRGDSAIALGGYEAKMTGRPHVSERALDVFSEYAVLSRMNPDDKQYSLEKRLRMYRGDAVSGVGQIDVIEKLKKEQANQGDGFRGKSPAKVAEMVKEAVAAIREQEGCLDPITAYDMLVDRLYSDGEKVSENPILDIVEKGNQEWTVDCIRRAYEPSYRSKREDAFKNYIAEAQRAIFKDTTKQNYTGETVGPDAKYLASIEDAVDITAELKKTLKRKDGETEAQFQAVVNRIIALSRDEKKQRLRSELLVHFDNLKNRKRPINFANAPEWLQKAIDNKIFDYTTMQSTVQQHGVENASTDDAQRLEQLESNLVKLVDLCDHCVPVVLSYAKSHSLLKDYQPK